MEKFSNVLPEDFDGVFRFSNPTTEDFVFRWGGKDYLYPALKTTPMFIENATPLEIQSIRKKAATKLAEREFFKEGAKKLEAAEHNPDGSARFNSIHQARQYNDSDLQEVIQKCLNPLPTAAALISDAPKEDIETKLTKTPKGKLRTRVLDEEDSLVAQAKGASEIE